MKNFQLERIALRYAAVLIVAAFTASLAFLQAVSQISGNAHDTSGAVLPGVEISVTAQDTGVKRSTTTDESGNFALPNLAPGPYRLEAARTGFRTVVQNGIQLQVDSNPVIPVVLGVGDVTQTVEVQANATLVETQKLGVGAVMENQRILLDLPLNGRNPTDLIALTGAAVQNGASPVWSMNTGVTISVAGGQNYGVYYGLDGAPNINLYDATEHAPLPFPDALLEFKVETSTQDAGTGTHSGAQVNAVTKSGANAFHGDAFEFFRNGDLNARNFFAASRDTLKRNQFGDTLGGPILKNKLFFFAGYQGTTFRQTPISTTAFVPTAAMDAGNFTTYASPACQGRQVNLGAPFVNNQIAISQMSPAAMKIAAKLPATSDPCGKFLTGNLVSQYLWQAPVRIDYQLSDKHSIFGRWLGTKINTVLPYSLSPNNILTTTGGSTNDLATVGDLPRRHLPLRLEQGQHFPRVSEPSRRRSRSFRFLRPDGCGHQRLQQSSARDAADRHRSVFTLGASLSAHEPIAFTFLEGNDDFSWIHGSHQISLGGNFAHSLVDITANVRSIGNYTINGQTTGLTLADFMAGDLSQMRQSATNGIIVAQYFAGLYAQDTWKLNPRLTLTYGLRWEPFTPMQVKDGKVYTFDMGRYNAGTSEHQAL